MPQLVVIMRDRALINIDCKLKLNSFKLRHAPYSNRCGQLLNVFPSLENHTTISLQKYTTFMQG